MEKNYDCSCFVEYPNKSLKFKNGNWKCVDKYEKVEDWKSKSKCGCVTHCRRKDREMKASNSERVMECLLCKNMDKCTFVVENPAILEDADGNCTQYEKDEALAKRIKAVLKKMVLKM